MAAFLPGHKGEQLKGYRLPDRTALIRFEGDYAGAEVRVRLSMSLGDSFEFATLASSPENIDHVKEVYKLFAQRLISWNLLDNKSKPIPATYEGMTSLEDMRFVFALIQAFKEEITGVSVPLAASSANGAMLEEALAAP